MSQMIPIPCRLIDCDAQSGHLGLLEYDQGFIFSFNLYRAAGAHLAGSLLAYSGLKSNFLASLLGLYLYRKVETMSTAVDAWEYGVQRHLASLPAAEREAFMAPAHVDDCMEKIRLVRHRHRHGYHKLVETLRPVIEPLKHFEGAVDVLSQTNSGILSPVWGPIRAVITVNHLAPTDCILTLNASSWPVIVLQHYKC